ncbi:PD-(D/E)XK nuclease family protein [Pseudocolwellia agarivorans]|uniref:PD-(D/E)XK nuclease family protein n=1 Tax=Pseudocolwellia agarivorans TaxID=1911682 RepID=UPI000985B238|nr:PD-(D/E)XK nuclease family protein [Pseudocolwellia agarivorans]
MSSPNIFSFATSELSQDAFICWFLSWAKEEHASKDLSLHNCAKEFISIIFEKHSLDMADIFSVEITKQDQNIDVLCVINNKFAIIIEDKTGTKHHSGQLKKYLDEILNRNYAPENILPIYYKTQDQSCYSKVLENGYKPFLRNEMISILEMYGGTNQILIDYRDHLLQITEQVDSFMYLPIEDWTWYSWIGFYLCLQEELKAGDWDYVANPRGGFLGFWWHWDGDDECEQYLQLEENKLCFKIRVSDDSDKGELRSHWHSLIQKKSSDINNLSIIKPPRFGSGKYMTVCINQEDYRVTKSDSRIDILKTIELLKSAESLLTSVQTVA